MNKEFKDHKVINDEKMKQNWEIIPFEDSIVKVKYTTKIPSNDYLEQGLYPIVSQEEGLISGYWNNKADVFKVSNPVIIFGDHTRILKYVDFDFVLGADGVKILQPIKGIDAKFFKLYLESCKIPSLGYSRHYKLLKELHIPIPPLPIQEKIVAELDCLSGVIEKKKEQLKELDLLAQSIFYTMFGDPITNEKGWEIKKLGEVCEIVGGSTPKTNEASYWDGNHYWVTPAELNGSKYISSTNRTITDEGVKSAHLQLLPLGTVLLSSRAPIGKVAITTTPMYCNQGFKNLVCTDKLNNEFAYWFLFNNTEYLNSLGTGATFKEISKRVVEQIPIPVPPLTLQQEFAAKVEAIEKQKGLIKESIKEVEDLFNARMQYYFG